MAALSEEFAARVSPSFRSSQLRLPNDLDDAACRRPSVLAGFPHSDAD